MLPLVTVSVPIPGALWRRWKDTEPKIGMTLQSLLPALLELYLDREERSQDGLTGVEYQI
jgi:hypothetical protein